MSASVLQIFVLRDGKLLASELFPEGVYLVGSDPSCDLVLDDSSVALQHAQLQFGGGQVLLVDDAGAGVLINGEAVQIAVVRSADDLSIGPFLIKTRVLAKRKSAAPAAPSPMPGGPRLAAVPSLASPARAQSLPAAPRAAPRVVEAPQALLQQSPQSAPAAEVVAAPVVTAETLPPLPAQDAELDAFDELFDKVIAVETQTPLADADESAELEAEVEVEIEAELADEVTPTDFDKLAAAPAEPARQPLAIHSQITGPIEIVPAAAPSAPVEIAAKPPPDEATVPHFDAAKLSAQHDDTVSNFDYARAKALREKLAASEAAAKAKAVPPPAPVEHNLIEPPEPAEDEPPLELLLPASKSAPRPRAVTPPPMAAAARPAVTTALRQPEKPKKSALSRSVAPGAGLQPTSVLHARVLWGDALVAARSFGAADWVDLGGDEEAALPAYGFPGVAQLAVYDNASWRIAPPLGVNVLERFADGPWRPVAADARGEVRLSGGRSVRLSGGAVHVELFAEWPQPLLRGALKKLVDWRGIGLVLTILAAVVTFITLLPPVPKVIPLPPPPRPRLVRAEIKPEKPKKPKLEKEKVASVQKAEPVKPSAAQSARNYRQAAAPLRALEKVTKATADVSRLLAGLKLASYRPKGGSQDALPVMPSGSSPKPLPGIGGGVGMGGTPVTHGQDLLRGGPGGGRGGGAGDLGSGTAGKGPVRGIPTVLPSRPTKIQGQIDRDAVLQVINDHINEVRGCYERALLDNPNLGAGKVLIEWTIGAEGDVVEVGTKVSTLKSPEAVGCLLDLYRGLHFPKPQGGPAIISYPFLFNSVGL